MAEIPQITPVPPPAAPYLAVRADFSSLLRKAGFEEEAALLTNRALDHMMAHNRFGELTRDTEEVAVYLQGDPRTLVKLYLKIHGDSSYKDRARIARVNGRKVAELVGVIPPDDMWGEVFDLISPNLDPELWGEMGNLFPELVEFLADYCIREIPLGVLGGEVYENRATCFLQAARFGLPFNPNAAVLKILKAASAVINPTFLEYDDEANTLPNALDVALKFWLNKETASVILPVLHDNYKGTLSLILKFGGQENLPYIMNRLAELIQSNHWNKEFATQEVIDFVVRNGGRPQLENLLQGWQEELEAAKTKNATRQVERDKAREELASLEATYPRKRLFEPSARPAEVQERIDALRNLLSQPETLPLPLKAKIGQMLQEYDWLVFMECA